MTHPQARQDELVVQEVFDELVIYDLAREQVHSLNRTAALVWQQCDGRTSQGQLAARLQTELDAPQSEELVWLTLDRLEKAHLLDEKVVRPQAGRISRRHLLQKLGITVALLPVVASIPAPAAAQSWTCIGDIRDFNPPNSGDWGPAANCGNDAFLDSLCQSLCGAGSFHLDCEHDGVVVDKVWCCCRP